MRRFLKENAFQWTGRNEKHKNVKMRNAAADSGKKDGRFLLDVRTKARCRPASA